MRQIIISTRARDRHWNGPLRAWLDQRARELRDEATVQRVRVDEHVSDPAGRSSWLMRLELASTDDAQALVRDVVQDLQALKAEPELVEC